MKVNTRLVFGGLVVIAGAVALTIFLMRPEFCDGLPREIGACDADRPVYYGMSCDEVAAEWGRQLDAKVLEVIDGPADARGQARSSRLFDAEVLTSQLANKHMRESGITSMCEVEEFLGRGEAEFSPRTSNEVGSVMFDGNPEVEYPEWRARLHGWVELIMTDPETPYGP